MLPQGWVGAGMGWEQVAYLMKHVPPGALANAVARRAVRGARSRLDRLRSTPTDVQLLAAFGAANPDALAPILAEPRLRAHWSLPSRAMELRGLADRVPGLRERALARAEKILSGRCEVFGREVSLEDPRVWRRDPHTGWLFAGSLQRPGLPAPGSGDPKRVWALARADWAIALAQGAWLCPERASEFGEKFVQLTDSLLVEALAGEGIHSASAMEVSLRAMNLALALAMFRGNPALGGRFLLRTLRALTEHAAFAHAHLEDSGAVPNNHLIAGWVGLLNVAALFPELPGARTWRANAVEGLAREFPKQVLADGMGFEGSTGYHRLLLELGILALLAARAMGDGLAATLSPVLARMGLASRHMLHAGGLAPQVGDHDSGRAFAFTDRRPLELGYLAPLCAALFHDARAKSPTSAFPDEAAWLLGRAGFEAFEVLAPTGGAGSVSLCDFGLAVLRRGQASLSLRAGSTGQRGVGGHGHNDALSIELYLAGKPVIVDCGTWTYLGDPAGRDRFRGTAMHATVQVDGAEQSPIPPGRPFALPDRARAKLCELHRGEDFDRASASHQGYAPVLHRREVLLADGAALIVDDLCGPGLHQLASRFHLPDLHARIRPLGEGEQAELARLPITAAWNLERAVEIGPADSPRAVLAIARGAELALCDGAYSPGYDERVPARSIEITLTAELPVRLATALLFHTGSPPATEG